MNYVRQQKEKKTFRQSMIMNLEDDDMLDEEKDNMSSASLN